MLTGSCKPHPVEPGGVGLFCFQYTLTPYNSKIGREKVVWRYDPIFITPKMTVEFHLEAFSRMIDVIGEHIVKAI